MPIISPTTWPEDEANDAATLFIELMQQGETHDYLHQWIIRERNHWAKVFNDMLDMRRFQDAFNRRIFDAGLFNCAM
jgi:hypothetical protein